MILLPEQTFTQAASVDIDTIKKNPITDHDPLVHELLSLQSVSLDETGENCTSSK